MNIVSLKLDQIVGQHDRLRSVNEGYAQELAESFRALGQIVPIEVVETKEGSEKYRIVHGAHRRRAAEINGDDHIQAIIWKGDKRHEKGRQIAENMIRAPLTVMTKASSVGEWQKLYPKAQWGGDRRSDQFSKIATCPPRFAVHAANKIGISETAVRILLRINQGISAPVRSLIENTEIEDQQDTLIALAAIEDSNAQLRIVKEMLETGRTIKEVMESRPEPDKAEDQKVFDSFRNRFLKADEKARRRIIQWLIDEGHIRPELAPEP